MSAPDQDQAPQEETRLHTRILRCALEVEHCQAWWRHADPEGERPSAETAFGEWWFGSRSLARVDLLIQNMRARFDAFPPSLATLHAWTTLGLDDARVLCHWHLQLSDPLYRAFSGEYLPELRRSHRAEVSRDQVARWVAAHGLPSWGVATRVQFASKLLSAAHEAGLVLSVRDPRPLGAPRVSDLALGYLFHLLKAVRFSGTLLENPYLASVDLEGGALFSRLRANPDLQLHRLGDVSELVWRHADLSSWCRAHLSDEADAA